MRMVSRPIDHGAAILTERARAATRRFVGLSYENSQA